MGATKGTVSRWALATGTAFAVLAAVLTRHGIRYDPDSAGYLATARLLADHPSRLLLLPRHAAIGLDGRYPPVYPAAIAAATRTGDAITAARWLGVVLAAVFGAISGALLRQRCSAAVTAATLLLLAMNRGLVLVLFGFLMSDGLHATLALAMVALVQPLLADPPTRRPWAWTLSAAMAASLGFGARLAGVGLVVALVEIILLLDRASVATRAKRAGAVLAIGLLPTAWWMAHQGAGGTVGSRPIGWTSSTLAGMLPTDWIVGGYLPEPIIGALGRTGGTVFGLLLLALAVALTWSIARRARLHGGTSTCRLQASLVLVAWTHLVVLDVSRLLFDPLVEISGRHTMVWWTCMILATGLEVQQRLDDVPAEHARRARSAAWATVLAVALLAAGPTMRAIVRPSEAWSNVLQHGPSAPAAAAGRLPASTVLYANSPDTVYLQTGRISHLVLFHRQSSETDAQLRARVRRTVALRCRRPTAFVLHTDRERPDQIALEALDRLSLTVVYRGPEGTVRTCAGATR